MKRITATDTLDLSIPERILLAEDIWDTIQAEADSVLLTNDEKKIIDERLTAYHMDQNQGSPWKNVYKRIINK